MIAELPPETALRLPPVVAPKGVADDFAQDLSTSEKHILTATQGPTAAAAFGANITTAAWKTKPSWFVIAGNDRAIPPELQRAEAARMNATSITLSVGGNSIKIDTSGITINGMQIQMQANSTMSLQASASISATAPMISLN